MRFESMTSVFISSCQSTTESHSDQPSPTQVAKINGFGFRAAPNAHAFAHACRLAHPLHTPGIHLVSRGGQIMRCSSASKPWAFTPRIGSVQAAFRCPSHICIGHDRIRASPLGLDWALVVHAELGLAVCRLLYLNSLLVALSLSAVLSGRPGSQG